ncbi:hypothetical protein Pmani_007194 [Petrolisthes manimaculis]|uniref:Uncharacterized protein n=1 Tax=Petrolisthes manimaculis TaxID=1843537 RepID=A0AAE1UIY1_9EUCA|nr:hypothetical protein Pmani_007194 [Petrolisthes manimaculis]
MKCTSIPNFIKCLQYALRKRSRSLKVKVLPGAPSPLSVSHSTLATAASRQVLLLLSPTLALPGDQTGAQ